MSNDDRITPTTAPATKTALHQQTSTKCTEMETSFRKLPTTKWSTVT